MTPRKRGMEVQQEQQAEQRPEPQVLKVPLRWEDVEAKEFVFANEVFARYASGVYWVTFGQVHGPYEAEPDRERLQREGLLARPVAKIAVSPERLADFLEKLKGLYDRMSGGRNLQGKDVR